MKRLDLDAARSRNKKSKMTNSNVPMAMADVSLISLCINLIS
jgi:hypothetical protein